MLYIADRTIHINNARKYALTGLKNIQHRVLHFTKIQKINFKNVLYNLTLELWKKKNEEPFYHECFHKIIQLADVHEGRINKLTVTV